MQFPRQHQETTMPTRQRWLWVLPLALLMCTTLALAPLAQAEKPTAPSPQGAEFRVGIDDGDIRGNDHRALQAAVDYVGSLGGGTVSISPGRYEMRNALVLRDNVRVVGVPGKTVLAACDSFRCRLAADGDC